MASSDKDLTIESLRGGMNDQDPPHSLEDDQTVQALNVEFFLSTLGERRRGCEAVSIVGSGLGSEDEIVHLTTHLPRLGELTETQLWAVGATEDTSLTVSQRLTDLSWSDITPIDAFDTSYPAALRIQTQDLHGKLYWAYKLNDPLIDRLHVFDGSQFRRAGLAAPLYAPTVADSGVAGAFTDDRIYRVRVILEEAGGIIDVRSEPSPEVTFTPSGTDSGATITQPVLPGEGETHWEIEASDGDGNFYVLTTLGISTLTYTDTTIPATDYAEGELSADIGAYDLIPAVKFVKADQDRLVFGGHWTDAQKASRVSWTPVGGSTGNGNDERIDSSVDSFLDLDWQEGGQLTGLSDPLFGSFYAFKWTRIYKLQRTGDATEAYEAFILSKQRGAIPGTIVNGLDEAGRGCVYFLDPSIGPTRIGSQGLQAIKNLRTVWRRVNTSAEKIVGHGVYYPDKQQIHWWVSLDGADTPNFKMILQVNDIRSAADGCERGWVTADGRSSEAWCSTVLPEIVTEPDNSTTLSFRPYIGLDDPDFIQRTDVGDHDAGQTYKAKIVTKPYILAGLLNRWGAMTAALLAVANSNPLIRINVKFIRNFGLETNETTTDFLPEQTETLVIKTFDNLVMSDAKAIQVEFSDLEPEDL